MKAHFQMVALVATISLTQALDLKCNLKVFERDTNNWRDIFAGMLLGLHSGGNVNKENCDECREFGVQLGRINTGLVGVEATKKQWENESTITTQDVFKIGQTLVNIYVIFMSLFIPLDSILTNKDLMDIPTQLFLKFSDPAEYVIMFNNTMDYSAQIGILLMTIPGADCYEIGYRMATIPRFLFGLKYHNFETVAQDTSN